MPVLNPPAATPGIQSSGLDLIKSALRLINVLESGEVPSDDEANDALLVLNQMLDSWNNERLMVFTIVPQTVNLTAGKQAYTIGPNGDFNVTRPPFIETVSVISLQNPQQPLELTIQYLTKDQWAQIPVKNVTSALPRAVWDDLGYPLRTLSYWPIPNIALQTNVYGWTALSQFADLVTKYTFPPGYYKALRYCLAVDLVSEFSDLQAPPPTVLAQALEEKRKIKVINQPLLDLHCDAALVGMQGPGRGQYNWLSDGFGARGGSY